MWARDSGVPGAPGAENAWRLMPKYYGGKSMSLVGEDMLQKVATDTTMKNSTKSQKSIQ